MFDLRDLRPGLLFWCDTSRNAISLQFSDKEFRPVLIVSALSEFDGVAVYPCSRFRDIQGRSDQMTEPFGETETHIIYGKGLFLIQPDDLHPPTAAWSEWPLWKQTHRRVIEDDLRSLKQQQRHHKPAPVKSTDASSGLNTRLSDSLDAQTRARLEQLKQPPPPFPKPVPPPPKPKLPPRPPVDLFKQAVDSILPYHILRPEDEEDAEPSTPPNKSLKRKRR